MSIIKKIKHVSQTGSRMNDFVFKDYNAVLACKKKQIFYDQTVSRHRQNKVLKDLSSTVNFLSEIEEVWNHQDVS